MPEKKGKAGNPDDIMSPADMKPILAHARHAGPVSCVIALTKEKDGVILLDKRKKPKQLMAELKKQAASAGLDLEMPSLRFGRATVDTEQDGGLLTFVVNKDTSGAMRPRLLERVKKVGFSKVEIIVDESLDEEPEEDPADPPVGAGAVSQPSAATQSSTPPDPGVAPSVPPQPAPPGQDATTLTRTLTELVRQMVAAIAADPTRGNALKGLATQAQSSLRTGDIASAARSVEELRRALDGAGAQPAAASSPPAAQAVPVSPVQPPVTPAAAATSQPPSAPAPDAEALTHRVVALVKRLVQADPATQGTLKGLAAQVQAALKSGDLATAGRLSDQLSAGLDGTPAAQPIVPAPPAAAADTAARNAVNAKARLAWVATRQKVDGGLGKLHDAFTNAFKGHPAEGDVTKAFRTRVDTVLDTLDEGLAHRLDAVNSATDPGLRGKLVQEAHALIGQYSKHIASDPTIAALDKNPFVSLSIQKTMTDTLSALSKTIR
jgi:hypothetical protein